MGPNNLFCLFYPEAGLKLGIQKAKIMASSSIFSQQIDGEKVETVADFTFLSFKITADGDGSHKIKTNSLLETEAVTNLALLVVQSQVPATLRDPTDCSTPGRPGPPAQVHAHCICDATQPSHPLMPSSPQSFPASGSFSNELAVHIRRANLDSILKSRDIALPMNVYIVEAMVFPVFMYRCES